jgi:DNA-binding CsgD family transcriptional regulator/tetratricopeptide (TPR) repeat protein
VTGSQAYVSTPPRLVGREDALRQIVALAAERPGVVAVVGEAGAGTTRLAREAAARLGLDGAVVISAEDPGPGLERLQAALVAAGHNPDPTWSARLRPIVIVLGDRPGEPGLSRELARRLGGSRALVILTGREVSPDVPSVVLERLASGDAADLVTATAPGLDRAGVLAVVDMGDGLPGRLVPLALAARRRPAGDGAIPIPDPLMAWADGRLAGLEPWPLDVAGWAAVLGGAVTPEAIARVCRRDPQGVERALEDLVRAGVMEELPGPPRPRWRFGDRLLAAALTARLGGPELRRRHAASLVAGRAAGAPAGELARHAVGAADGPAAARYCVRAAEEARGAGDPELALQLAERALAWWTPEIGEPVRAAALHERGMALLDLSSWADAAEALEEAAAGRRESLEREAALASISAASSARWSLGQHDAALRLLQDHLGHGRDPRQPPSAARAVALSQAAGMAVMTSRFAEAMTLAGDARGEAAAVDDQEVSTRALIFMGMAESGRGSPGGLLHLARARREAKRTTGAAQRNETLAMIHESHVLLALGRPAEAAECARDGLVRADELGLTDHHLVLAGNLGEALAAAGDLAGARAELERAAAGWEALGRGAPTPADPGMAWLLLAEGRIDAALDRYRTLAAEDADAGLFELLAPVATGHALAALAAGEEDEAAEVVAAALEAWRLTDDRLTSIPLLAAGAEAGTLEDAAACAASLAEMDAGGVQVAGPFRAYAEGQLARRRNDPDRAARLREAAAALEGVGLRWWSARALMAAGTSEADADRAGDDLLAARRAFREMGAEGWRRRAEARLRAIGRRIPTRAPGGGPGAGSVLSAREREVLEQVALGLRNRDIGERLFISERTVARHLVQIYAKLGVSTRTAAVRAGRERGILSAETP